MSSVSVIIITQNEEANIALCLPTVSWADEIVVVDSGSTDNTVEVAKKFTKKVFVEEWAGYGAAKNIALSHCSSEWVLWIDADERVSGHLQEELLSVVASNNPAFNAYAFPRKANFLGRWILHCGWYPGRVTRLFRRGSGKFTEEKVHERLDVEGLTGNLKGDLLHYTDPSLVRYFDKFNKYTSLAADELADEHRAFNISQVTVRPLWTFIKMYFLKLGFLDGVQGFILCVLSSCYVFVKYAKLWERENRRTPTGDSL